jgi:hypothetical protein
MDSNDAIEQGFIPYPYTFPSIRFVVVGPCRCRQHYNAARDDGYQIDNTPVLGYQTICGVDGCDNPAIYRNRK